MGTRQFIVPSPQGVNETIAYALDVTVWGGTPASPTTMLYDVTAPSQYDDVSGTNLDGSASVSGNIITTKQVTALAAGHRYRINVGWTNSGNTLEAYGFIEAEQ